MARVIPDELIKMVTGYLPDEVWVIVSQDSKGTQVVSNSENTELVLQLLGDGINRIEDGPPEETVSVRKDS